MNDSIKKLARSALITALGFALLYAASFIPTGRMALAAVAGLLTAVILISCGTYYSAAVFAATAVLGLLILPIKSPAVIYTVFLGYYPILKSYLERIKRPLIKWILKLLIFNVVFAAVWLLAKDLIAVDAQILTTVWVAAQAAGNAVFIAYDILVSRLIHYYILRFAKYFK